MKTLRTTIGGLLMAVLLGSCGKNDGPEQKMAAEAPATEAPATGTADAEAEGGAPGAEAPALPTPPAVPTNRLLVYHADIRLKVSNLTRTIQRLDSLVQRSGGYLSAAAETRENGEWRQEMTLRLPPGRFQSTLRALTRLGTVEHKNLTTDDVTAEHADVAARLGTKRAVEQRYVALLAKAQKISDILAIEKQIGEVREEIESTESRLKTLNDQVAYATVTLSCYQPTSQDVPDAPVISFGSRLVAGFYDGWELLTGLLLALVSAWPLVLLGGATWWAVRRYRAKRRLPAPPLPPVQPVQP